MCDSAGSKPQRPDDPAYEYEHDCLRSTAILQTTAVVLIVNTNR
eukprot:COSAG01_NODE_8010_length_2955_cov_2.282213_1_plen_44_part_00